MPKQDNDGGRTVSYRWTLAHQSNKLSEQFHPNLDPPYKDLAEICHEYDTYLCDRLAKELYGIQDLSLHIDKIKAFLNSKE